MSEPQAVETPFVAKELQMKWVFWICLSIATATAVLGYFSLGNDIPAPRSARLLLCAVVGSGALALTWGVEWIARRP